MEEKEIKKYLNSGNKANISSNFSFKVMKEIEHIQSEKERQANLNKKALRLFNRALIYTASLSLILFLFIFLVPDGIIQSTWFNNLLEKTLYLPLATCLISLVLLDRYIQIRKRLKKG